MENINVSKIDPPSGIEEEIIQNINQNISQDLTMDGSYGMGYRSPSISLQNHHGMLSPSQGRSVREFEEQMDALRKENFNLKLRIYVLEEKLPFLDQIKTPEGQDSLMKQYLDNKVNTEVLKNDLEEKLQLLREASEAICHMENIQKESDRKNCQIIDDLKHKIQILEHANKILERHNKSTKAEDESKARASDIENAENSMKVRELETSIKNSEDKIRDLTNQIRKLEEIILKKTQSVEEFKKHIHELKMENIDLKDNLISKEKALNSTDSKKLQNDLEKCRSEMADKICELDELQEKFTKLNEDYEKALKYIEKLIEVTTVMRSEIEQLKKDSDKENESNAPNESITKSKVLSMNNKKLQNKIEVLSNQLHSATAEAENKNSLLEKLKIDLEQTRENADRAHRWSRECSDICNILTNRLEELAGFLNSLLKHKEVLNAITSDRKREIQDAVNKSLDLSRSLTADTLSITNLSFDDSNLAQLSNITGILEASHKSNELMSDFKLKVQSFEEKNVMSTSFVKSENKKDIKRSNSSLPIPGSDKYKSDHNVTLRKTNSKNSNIEFSCSVQSGEENTSRSKLCNKITQYEEIINQKDNKILQIQCQLVEADNRLKQQNIMLTETSHELKEKENKVKMLELELDTFKIQINNFNTLKENEENLRQKLQITNDKLEKLESERDKLYIKIEESELIIKNLQNEAEKLTRDYEENINQIKENEYIQMEQMNQEFKDKLNERIQEFELKHEDNLKKNWVERIEYNHLLEQAMDKESELVKCKSIVENLKESEANLKEQLNNNQMIIEKMQKNIEENLLSISKGTLEKTKISNEKLNLEKYVKELIQNCESLRGENILLLDQLNGFIDKQCDYNKAESDNVENANENQRLELISPDLGIESDTGRISNEPVKIDENPGLQSPKKENNLSNEEDVNEKQLSSHSEIPIDHKCDEVQRENCKLRTKYKTLIRLYRQMVRDFKKSNEKMEHFENKIKDEIQKTNVVLEYARNNLSNKNKNCKKEK